MFVIDRNYKVIECNNRTKKTVEELYKDLNSSNITVPPINISADDSNVPEVTPDEIICLFLKICNARREWCSDGCFEKRRNGGS